MEGALYWSRKSVVISLLVNTKKKKKNCVETRQDLCHTVSELTMRNTEEKNVVKNTCS